MLVGFLPVVCSCLQGVVLHLLLGVLLHLLHLHLLLCLLLEGLLLQEGYWDCLPWDCSVLLCLPLVLRQR